MINIINLIRKKVQAKEQRKGAGIHDLNNEFKYLLSSPRYSPLILTLFDNDYAVPDAISFYYSYKEIFNERIYEFKTKNEKPLIIDCGANYGTSILFFKRLYHDAKVIGFEADPFIYSFLEKNIKSQKLADVEIHNTAIWKEEGEFSFTSEKADAGRLASFNDVNSPNEQAVQVKTHKLSKYLGAGKVDMLKIDIEGAEVEVLKECKEQLSNVNNIFVEYHSFVDRPQELDVLLMILRESGFRYKMYSQFCPKRPLIEHDDYLGMDLQMNIFGYRD